MELDILASISGIVGDLTITSVILFVWYLERKDRIGKDDLIVSDWKRQRESETENRLD